MSLKSALSGGMVAGIGLLALLFILLEILFYLALLVVVFGGAYFLLEHFGVLMVGVPL